MAYIVDKGTGCLVRWREDGKPRSQYFRAGGRDAAEALMVEMNRQAEVRKFLKRGRGGDDFDDPTWEQLGDPDWWAAYRRRGVPEADDDPRFGLATYLRRLIREDAELRDSSRYTYEQGVQNHIADTRLGKTHIAAITEDDLRTYWADLKGGVGVRRNVYLLLSKAFNAAVRQGVVEASALKRSGIKQPSKNRQVEEIPLTVAELEKLSTSARNDRDRLAILMMGWAGLRAGEVSGLRVQDVDFKRCRIAVRQQGIQLPGKKFTGPLKSKAANRRLDIACSVVRELEVLVPDAAEDGRLFHDKSGGIWAAVRINEAVHRAAKAAGMRSDIHAHLLRHTAVSLLVDRVGANPKAVQVFCGHSNITETLQTYGHLFDYGGSVLAEGMETLRQEHRDAADGSKAKP